MNDCWHTEENDLKNRVVGVFQKLYSKEGGWCPCIEGLSFMGLASSEPEGLEIPFSEEEVFATLSDLRQRQSPLFGWLYHGFLVVLLGHSED